MPPRALYSAEQVRAADRIAIETCAIPGIELMERAGLAAFRALARTWPLARRIGVLCGAGNNAGDGYIVARLAHEAGFCVRVGALSEPQKLVSDAALAYERYRHAGGAAVVSWKEALERPQVLVDGLLGTGLARAVGGEWLDAVQALGTSDAPVLALDIPSGLSADTGQPLGAAVRAQVTVTFIGMKRGLCTGSGRDHAGEVIVDTLGLEEHGFGTQSWGDSARGSPFESVRPCARYVRLEHFEGVLGPRDRSAHKGRHGHVLVIGGDHGMGGAPRLAAHAAARTGAGLVSVATREEHVSAITAVRPELMARGVDNPQALDALLGRADVICLGPGLGTAEWGESLLERALGHGCPVVADADALNLLARGTARRERGAAPWVMTPHPAEAGRLLGVPTAEVERDRFAVLEALCERWNAVVVLKGAGTLVGVPHALDIQPADRWPDATPLVAGEGNPGMATGGSGDVLCGVIGALLAQGLDAPSAARVGVCLHAAAGDAAARAGERGMLAGDQIEQLRPAVNRL